MIARTIKPEDLLEGDEVIIALYPDFGYKWPVHGVVASLGPVKHSSTVQTDRDVVMVTENRQHIKKNVCNTDEIYLIHRETV